MTITNTHSKLPIVLRGGKRGNSIRFLAAPFGLFPTTLLAHLALSLAYKLLKKRINNENGHVLGNLGAGAEVGVVHRERRRLGRVQVVKSQ